MDLFRRIFGKSTEFEDHDQEDQSAASTISNADTQEAALVDEGKTAELKVPQDPGETLQLRQPADGATRPLSPEPVISSRNSHITFGQSTDTGMVRSNNQDSALSFLFTSKSVDERPDFGLFVVADGMGGHQDGEKASAITTRTMASEVTNRVWMPMLAGEEDNSDRPSISESLVEAVKEANNVVIREVTEGGGTTLSAVAVLGDLAYIAHVGDSRIYLINKDEIEQITRDHSLVQRLIELGQLTEVEAADHPQKNVLYKAVGQNETLEVDTLTRRLPPNSYLLLCSDGLWGHVEKAAILEVIKQYPDPQEACDRLIAYANTQGGTDNITAILLKVPGK